MGINKSPTILILGAQGMVGHTIYQLLKENYTTYATTRGENNPNFFQFNAETDKLELVYEKIGALDYIINCIGILPDNKNLNSMYSINALFPHKTARFAKEINAKLIHISSDAVFATNVKEVYEDSSTSPADYYGKTKLEGEPNSKNALTIRTSFLGFDPIKHKGLLEFAYKEKPLIGYSNQNWSGCTSLQFAQFCKDIISNDRFDKLRTISPVFHFIPIRNVSKHDIINSFLKLTFSTKKVTASKGKSISRSLSSRYSKVLQINKYSSSLSESLQELIQFENRNNG